MDPAIRFLGSWTAIRASGANTQGAYCLIEQVVPSGFASPHHVHHAEDESFYVLEGELAILCGGKWVHAGPGDYVFGPRDIPHGFRVVSGSPARILIFCVPAGFEQFMIEMSEPDGAPPAPPDIPKLIAVAATYNIDILGPLPEEE